MPELTAMPGEMQARHAQEHPFMGICTPAEWDRVPSAIKELFAAVKLTQPDWRWANENAHVIRALRLGRAIVLARPDVR